MEIKRCIKESFSVIGKEGSTKDGNDFIRKLWEEANRHFDEIAPLAKREKDGAVSGIWGAMSDFSRSFQPWEDQYSQGLYLAGAEAADDAEAPEGWVKWTIPGYEYLYVKNTGENLFSEVIAYMKEEGLELAGAVQEFNCPKEQRQEYLCFPIRRL